MFKCHVLCVIDTLVGFHMETGNDESDRCLKWCCCKPLFASLTLITDY